MDLGRGRCGLVGSSDPFTCRDGLRCFQRYRLKLPVLSNLYQLAKRSYLTHQRVGRT